MDKNKKSQAEKLQIKLDKLLQSKVKKQTAFDKTKKELADINKNIDSTKLKLFEILQSGSDDLAFSSWAKRKIGESEKSENSKTANRENASSDNSVNPNSAKSENATTPVTQNAPNHTGQNHQ